jgi:hypothetical protein
MPVAVRSANGDKAFALTETTGIDGKASDRTAGRAKACAMRGGNDLA